MSWKQLIPISFNELDTVTRIVACEILMKTRNTDMQTEQIFWHGNKQHLIKLKRGQCVFAAKRFSQESAISLFRIKRSLFQLTCENPHIKINIKQRPFGAIITVLNYDSISEINIKDDSKRTSNEHQTNRIVTASNKHVKHVKPENHVKQEIKSGNEKDGISEILLHLQNYEPTFGFNSSVATRILDFLSKLSSPLPFIDYVAKKNRGYLIDVKRMTEWEYPKYLQQKTSREGEVTEHYTLKVEDIL